MARCKAALGPAALLSVIMMMFTTTTYAQRESGLITDLRIKTGAGFEYMARTLSWDDSEEDSTLKTMMFTFRPALEINRRITLGGIVGYALPDFDKVFFRELPLSLQLDLSSISSWVVGGELEAALFEIRDFEIGVRGEYVYYMGTEDTMEIPLPSADGEALTTSSWSRIHAGVQVTYIPYSFFYPYLRLAYDSLAGSFDVQQTILDLSGAQKRDFTSKGKFNAVVGLFYEPLDRLEIRGEVQIIPNGDNVDFAVAAGLTYVF
jgi:hypothetical protein